MSSSHEIDSTEPLELFDLWLTQAEGSELNDPNAVALATSTGSGQPSVRMVLAKRIGDERFCFFTNAESRKGMQLAENPMAAMCFHWKSLRRQVRVEGAVSDLDSRQVDTYFHSRPRVSQLGAIVSQQSRVLTSRAEMEESVRKLDEEILGEIPRPAYWRGFCITPTRIEFWMDGENRLHDRFLFTRKNAGWEKVRLYP